MTAVQPDLQSRPDRQITVGLFTDNYGPGHSGLLYAVHFLEGKVLQAGHRVMLVAPAADGPNPYRGHPRRSELRLPSTVLPGIPARVATSRGFEAALKKLRQDPPDVIHVHGFGPVGLLGVWAAQRTGKPLLVTWHTDFEAYADHYWQFIPVLDLAFKLVKFNTGETDLRGDFRLNRPRWFARPKNWKSRENLEKLCADMLTDADLVTSPSDKTANRVLDLAPQARVISIPNGVDPLPLGPAIRKGPGPRILYVGRIALEKGIPLLVDAFSIVRTSIPNAELMFVGDWKQSTKLRTFLKSAAKNGGITLVGQVQREKLGPYYESADVFAFPSQTDTQALVLHEAAHAGCPIVTVDPDLRLVVDEGVNAMVAKPTPESLADALLQMLHMLEDPAARFRAKARSRELANNYTIDKQSSQYLQIYLDMAAGRPLPGSRAAVPKA